jgi:hypothetical protein
MGPTFPERQAWQKLKLSQVPRRPPTGRHRDCTSHATPTGRHRKLHVPRFAPERPKHPPTDRCPGGAASHRVPGETHLEKQTAPRIGPDLGMWKPRLRARRGAGIPGMRGRRVVVYYIVVRGVPDIYIHTHEPTGRSAANWPDSHQLAHRGKTPHTPETRYLDGLGGLWG